MTPGYAKCGLPGVRTLLPLRRAHRMRALFDLPDRVVRLKCPELHGAAIPSTTGA